jgi:hypothetical protein
MKCSRCNGFMVVEDCLDTKGEPGQLWIRALRCVMCGNLIDPIIHRHRDGFRAQVLPYRNRVRRAPRTPVARLTA